MKDLILKKAILFERFKAKTQELDRLRSQRNELEVAAKKINEEIYDLLHDHQLISERLLIGEIEGLPATPEAKPVPEPKPQPE